MMQLFTRKRIKQRYEISEMTLWRWENSDKLGFPKPIVVNRRKFYREEDIINWERAHDRAEVSV